jgi:hypothetical protein
LSPKLQLYIPPVSQVIAALSQLIGSGQVTTHLLTTLRRFLEGYLLAAAIAVTLGVVLGYFRFAYSLLEMLIEFLRPMPSVAIIPVAILLLGIGDAMIVAVTVYASTWPILINYRWREAYRPTDDTAGSSAWPAAHPLANRLACSLALYRYGSAGELVHRFDPGHDGGNDRRQQRSWFFHSRRRAVVTEQ